MAARTKTAALPRTLPSSHFKLLKTFPLIHIGDDAHLEEALAVIDRLLREDLDKGGEAYSEADVLRELMGSNRITQPQLAKKVGIAQSTISAVLTGDRSLTKNQVIRLARFFHVPPAVFLPA